MPRRPARRSTAPAAARRVIAYVRVSTEKQADGGHSLEAQRSKVAAWCALHDAELVNVFEDAGLSACTLEGRPALSSALAELAAGRADALLVCKLDRLTRSTRDLGELLDRATAGGWALLSVAESLDTSTAAGRLVVSVLGAVAQWEREAVGERTAAAMASMKAAGLYCGGTVPYGYRVDADGRLVTDEAEAAVKRCAGELRAAGLSLRQIGAALAERGLLPRNGGRWNARSVSRLVTDEDVAAAA
jgi:DNA invertase Pin-like site-specific DNA recombinase